MINRRKLIQLILSEISGEKTYFDLKREIDLDSERGKGKLVKSIISLANSNHLNNSYLIIGVDDKTRETLKVNYIDDQKLQQLVRNYITPQIDISYENVPFPHSFGENFLGLIIISPSASIFKVKKDIWKLKKDEAYARSGSEITIIEKELDSEYRINEELVSLEKRASVKLKYLVDELVNFYSEFSSSYHPHHLVYNDQHLVCYSGYKDEDDNYGFKDGLMLSEVWLYLIGEGIRFFWTALEYVTVTTSSTSFIVTEYKRLFWNHTDFFSPYEKTEIIFLDDGKYEIKKEKVFISPTVSKEEIAQVLNDYTNALEHIKKGKSLDDPKYKGRFEIYPYELLIAILNNSFEAEILFNNYMLGKADGVCAESYMNAYNILSEVREDKTN